MTIVLSLTVRACLFQVFTVPSGSMENTLGIGDRIAVNKLTPLFGWEPSQGDVVVFKDPGGWLPSGEGDYLVKRVVATGGDTVQCTGTTMKVNGTALDESAYLYPGDNSCSGYGDFGPVTVPQGDVWVEGDHRGDSADSRYHQTGTDKGAVPVSDVVGPAEAVIWPLDELSWL
ncbi:signal peptidase I [Streptomyces sp. NBC_01465]|uniref:signal peptidase I n=1 Tax=Streptomyces sp. NBC_01465 TaxID=2903878 RepID=UPI003FCC276B